MLEFEEQTPETTTGPYYQEAFSIEGSELRTIDIEWPFIEASDPSFVCTVLIEGDTAGRQTVEGDFVRSTNYRLEIQINSIDSADISSGHGESVRQI